MSDQPGTHVRPGTAQAWESVRRVREPVAWALLVIAAAMVLVNAGQLFNLPGARLGVCGGPPTQGPSCFAMRAVYVTPQLADWVVIAPPVLSVILVAFSGGLTKHARRVLQTATVVQACTVVLGVISLAGTHGSDLPSISFIFDAAGIAIAATALIFTAALTRSQAVRSPHADSY